MLKVFTEYGIYVEKITNIVTDGGSAFCKEFKVYGKESDPLIANARTIENNDNDDDLRMNIYPKPLSGCNNGENVLKGK